MYPTFNGSNPISWLSWTSQYFDLYEIAREDRVCFAAYYLEGEANIWWQWISRVYRKKGKHLRWRDFEKELMICFRPSEYSNYDEVLAHIKQVGTLREYHQELERLASRVQDWQEQALVVAFIGGLKSELTSEVRVYRPKTYLDAIEVARMRDDHLSALKR